MIPTTLKDKQPISTEIITAPSAINLYELITQASHEQPISHKSLTTYRKRLAREFAKLELVSRKYLPGVGVLYFPFDPRFPFTPFVDICKPLPRLRKRRKAAKQQTKRRAFIDGLKDVPCMDCGNKYPPYVMDFDHRPDSNKKFDVSSGAVGTYSRAVVLEEAGKCDVVCANCHRERTHKRRNKPQEL
jgi:hypothetical protein